MTTQIRHVLQMSPQVSWVERVNSGTIQTKRGGWVKLAAEGTPDLIGMLCQRVGNYGRGTTLFVEIKLPGEHLRQAQLAFLTQRGLDGGLAAVLRDVSEVQELWAWAKRGAPKARKPRSAYFDWTEMRGHG